MRLPVCFLLFAASAFPELLSVGVKGGVPFSDAFQTARTGSLSYVSDTKRYTVGPSVEVHLPFHLGVELDALYKRLTYTSNQGVGGEIRHALTTANAWEFPLSLKVRFGEGIKPFVGIGPNFRHVSSIDQVSAFFTGGNSAPPELNNRFNAGLALTGGLEIGERIRIAPQVRYTRWGWENFRDPSGALRSNQDQAEFLIGITF